MSKNVAIVGLGVVGSGVFDLLKQNKVAGVKSVVDVVKKPNVTTNNFDDVLNDKDVKIVVETVGGVGVAYDYAKKCLQHGKHFITANKKLISEHGEELTNLAYENGVALLYSAACGGGIPFLQNLRNARKMDEIDSFGGILNGTTNFILDKMHREKLSYKVALAKAQQLGYAELDPSSDVCGTDTAYKITLGCMVAYNVFVNVKDMNVYGISTIEDVDVQFAEKHNARVRLCGRAERKGDKISAFVEPVFVAENSIESSILENINHAWYKCKECGTFSFTGQGAGKWPTGSNVVRDILSVQQGDLYFTEKENNSNLKVDNSDEKHKYYVRFKRDNYNAIPEKWIEKKEVDWDYCFVITKEIQLVEINNLLKDRKDYFYAKIGRNVLM